MKIKPPKIAKAKVSDHYPTEISQEQRRLTGVTRSLLHGYQESPARFLPKTKALQGLAGATRIRGGPHA